MHEVGIISAMLKTLERVMAEEELTHIEKVVLEVGELSGAVPRYMDAFPHLLFPRCVPLRLIPVCSEPAE